MNVTSAFCQVYKLRTTAISYKYKINESSWSDWVEWEETSVLVIIDVNKERITVYYKEIQEYDIYQSEGKNIDDEGDERITYYCINKDGLKCRIRLAKLVSRGGGMQLYIDYSDVLFVYNIYVLD